MIAKEDFDRAVREERVLIAKQHTRGWDCRCSTCYAVIQDNRRLRAEWRKAHGGCCP
jgi:hypothetical protein